MQIFVKTKPNAKREYVECVDETHFIAAVNAPAKEGKANHAVLKALAEYLKIAPSRLMIVAGQREKEKIIQID